MVSGIAKVDRLYNNLLSSQPLCFNFFAKLAQKKELAAQLLRCYLPQIKEVKNVFFEYAPRNWTFDNSAFDTAFEVIDYSGNKGLIGLECKYTDDFSRKVYNSTHYQEVYSQGQAFSAEYEDFMNPRFNQLFRNHLMVVHAVATKEYDFAVSGLFYFQEDKKAQDIGSSFIACSRVTLKDSLCLPIRILSRISKSSTWTGKSVNGLCCYGQGTVLAN